MQGKKKTKAIFHICVEYLSVLSMIILVISVFREYRKVQEVKEMYHEALKNTIEIQIEFENRLEIIDQIIEGANKKESIF